MNKVRKIRFINHPVLKNMEFDFTGRNGEAVDMVIFAGENGCGKSTIINELYKIVTGQSTESNITEYEVDGHIFSAQMNKTSEHSYSIKTLVPRHHEHSVNVCFDG